LVGDAHLGLFPARPNCNPAESVLVIGAADGWRSIVVPKWAVALGRPA